MESKPIDPNEIQMQIGDDEDEDSDPQQLQMLDNSQGEVY